MATGTGTITALNGAVIALSDGESTVTFNVTGTWSATLAIQATVDGINWFSVNGYVQSAQAVISTFSVNQAVVVTCSGFLQLQLIATAFTSGTINVAWSNSNAGNNTLQVYSTSAQSFITWSQLKDGVGNNVTSTTSASKQSLDITNIATATGYYSVPVNIRQSATTAANATVFSMRNAAASTKTVYIEWIELLMAFDSGTPLGRSTQRYDLVRFSVATPTAGTTETVVAMDSSAAATQVTDVRFLDTGLTTTGVVFGTAFATVGCPASDGATANYIRQGIAIKLAAGEGFCIRLNVAAVVGQSLTGEIVWSER